jgi:hypothetical protein
MADMTMPVHRFRGSPIEMGRQQGEALRHAIADSRKTFLSLERFQLLRPRWVPMPMFEFMTRQKARTLVEPPMRQHYPSQALYFDGLARGSGLGLGHLLLLASAELLLSKIEYTAAPVPGACSAAAVRTPEGLVLHKNFDYPEAIRPYYLIRGCAPDQGYSTLEMTVAPLAGSVDGVNERGLAVIYDYAFCTDRVLHAVPLTIVLNEMLRTCTTVNEALDFLSKRPRAGGALLMIADATESAASVELSNSRMSVRRLERDQPALTHSNHYQIPELQEVEIPRDAVYSENNVKPLRGKRVHESSFARGARLEELFQKSMSADDVWKRMSDHNGGSGNENTVCRHGEYWETTCAIQIFPAKGLMRFAWGKPCETKPSAVELREASAVTS